MTMTRIGVVGAGMMGTEIAWVMAASGAEVSLTDSDPARLEAVRPHWRRIADRASHRGEEVDAEAILARLETGTDVALHGTREMVIEAVFEQQAVKHEVHRALDAVLPSDAIIATNTSSISISVLAGALPRDRRARFVGTHFFSPVSRMGLVEVIPGFDTAEATVERAMAACRGAGKTPIRVKDVVGFAVNRLLHALWIEANRLVEEGVARPEDVDLACRLGLGHPIGPYRLMDEVTNALTLEVQAILHEAYGPRFLPRPILKQMVKAGRNGRKAGRGWYDYGDDQ
jgi:3-hydroxybutyryl-CoA dehydrogenase